MKKLAGIILIVALVFTLAACGSDVPPAGYLPEEYQTRIDRDVDVIVDDDPSDDDTPYEPMETRPIITDVFTDLASGERDGEITHIVIHFISNVIANRTDPYNIADIHGIFTTYGVSAHYIIDRDGTIHLAVPEERVAFHAGAGYLADFPDYENRLNQHSIGIELLGIGSQADMSVFLTAAEYDALDPALIGFADAQYEALNWLLHDILARHPLVLPDRRHIIGHSEYAPDKPDPGALFEWHRLDFMN